MTNELKKLLGNDYEVTEQHVEKTQGQSYDAIIVNKKGKNVSMTFDKNMSADEIAECVKNTEVPEINLDLINNYEQVMHGLYMQLIPVAGNEEKLSQIPHRNILDMAIVYRIKMPLNNEFDGSGLIDNILMEKYGVDEEQLHRDAEINLKPTLRNMNEVMREMIGDIVPNEDSPLWVASVEGGQNGACVIANEPFLQKAFDKFGNFFILPSSIHEVLLVQDDGNFKVKDMKDMVGSVNATEVAEKDILSNNVYYYDGKELAIAE